MVKPGEYARAKFVRRNGRGIGVVAVCDEPYSVAGVGAPEFL